jgi:hypothetical protein
MKLPKPHLIGGTFLPISGFEGSDYGYTEDQMLQFRREALEEAARQCDEFSIAEECTTENPQTEGSDMSQLQTVLDALILLGRAANVSHDATSVEAEAIAIVRGMMQELENAK